MHLKKRCFRDYQKKTKAFSMFTSKPVLHLDLSRFINMYKNLFFLSLCILVQMLSQRYFPASYYQFSSLTTSTYFTILAVHISKPSAHSEDECYNF